MIQKILQLMPELWQSAVVLLIFLETLRKSPVDAAKPKWLPLAAAAGILVAVFSLSASGLLFFRAYQIDSLSQFFKLAVLIGYFIVVLNADPLPAVDSEKRSDYFLFLSLSALGLMFLASTVELIAVYMALEISSYSLYALIPIRGKDKRAAEAGIKYVLFGAAATAVSLYGMSYILATQHSTYLEALVAGNWTWAQSPLSVVGLTLFMAGFFYKLALFPFHFWCPDVYDGTGNETAAYVATLPKLGAVVILIRLVAMLKPETGIITVLAVLGACSMTFGNLAALIQKDLKRMLGYSSVSHAGYIMVGLSAVSAKGLAAAGYYSLVYVLMNLACFWVICRLSSDGRNILLDDLNGLYKRAPGLAFIMAVGAFALVGLPPTAGFMGKFFLLTSAWNRGHNWLVIIACLNTAISIYYYLNIVRHTYTSEAETVMPALKPGSAIWGGVLATLLLLLGIFPGPVFYYAEIAGKLLLP